MILTGEAAITRHTLMYHNVVRPGDTFEHIGSSITRYFTTEARLREHLEFLASPEAAAIPAGNGLLPYPVVANGRPDVERSFAEVDSPEALPPTYYELTFDDGWAGTFEVAGPILEQHGLTATVFVTTGLIGQPHFADRRMLRDAVRSGRFRIGAHGVTHRLLETLSPDEVAAEIETSQKTLEDILGVAVDTFALPGGSRPAGIKRELERRGFRELHTSCPTSSVQLPGLAFCDVHRFAVTHTTTSGDIAEWLSPTRGLGTFVKHYTLDACKSLLGRRLYATLRRRALGSSDDLDMTDLVPPDRRDPRLPHTPPNSRTAVG